MILSSSFFGYALSTTHVTTGSVFGTGLARRGTETRWGVAGQVLVGWVVTLPAAAGMAAGAHSIIDLFSDATAGALVAGAIALSGCAVLWWLARRDPVTPDNVVPAT